MKLYDKLTRLGSSPSLDMARKLIADFYCTTPDKIDLSEDRLMLPDRAWIVCVNGKAMDSVILFKVNSRFVFVAWGDK